jgi:hypothetical protein
MLQTAHFAITDVQGIYSESSGLSPRPSQWVDVESMDIAWQDCGHIWAAFDHGIGHFDQTINGVTIVTCPVVESRRPWPISSYARPARASASSLAVVSGRPYLTNATRNPFLAPRSCYDSGALTAAVS